MTDAATCR